MSEPGEGGVLYMAGPPGSLLATEPQGGWSLPLGFLYRCIQVFSQGDQQPLQLKNRTGERGDLPLLWLDAQTPFPCE